MMETPVPFGEWEDVRHRLGTLCPSMRQLVIELKSDNPHLDDATELAEMLYERLEQLAAKVELLRPRD